MNDEEKKRKQREKAKRYRENNKEKTLETAKKSRDKNKEKKSLYNKEYRLKNIKAISERMVKHRAKPEYKARMKKLWKDYYSKEENKIRIKERLKREDVKEKKSAYFKSYTSDPTVKARLKEKQRKYDAERKESASVRVKLHRKKPEVIAARRDYTINNWKKLLMDMAKDRSKRKNIEFSITENDFEDPRCIVCPIFGFPFNKSVGKTDDDSATLDRIINSKGYVPGNVWTISSLANRVKHECDHTLLYKIANAVIDAENNPPLINDPDPSTRKQRMEFIKQRRCRNRRDRKLEFSITWENITLPEFCPCTGEPIDYENKHKDWRRWPNLDRIDNSKGYIPGNVWVISMLANTVKTTATGNQILTVAKALEAKVKSME